MKKINEFLNYLEHHRYLSSVRRIELQSLYKTNEDANIVELMVGGGFVESENLARIEAEFFNLPYVSLTSSGDPLVDVFPFSIARDNGAICFDKDGSYLKVAVIWPELGVLRKINSWAQMHEFILDVYVCSLDSYNQGVSAYSKDSQEDEIEQADSPVDPLVEANNDPLASINTDKIVYLFLNNAIKQSAEEIVLDQSDSGLDVYFRISGVLHRALKLPGILHQEIFNFLKGLANLSLKKLIGSGAFSLVLDGKEHSFELQFLAHDQDEKIIIKPLKNDDKSFDFSNLGFSQKAQDVLTSSFDGSAGKTMLFSPSQGGKTSTIYSLLDQLNGKNQYIVSLERNIEKDLSHVNQILVRPEVGLTHAQLLRQLNKHQPDLIVVDALRDHPAVEETIHSALSGANLLTSFEADDIISGLDKLRKMKIDLIHLSSVLSGLIAQRLVNRVCSYCGEAYQLSGDEENYVRSELSKIDKKYLPKGISRRGKLYSVKGCGCSWCDHTGYLGQVALSEAFHLDDNLRKGLASVQTKQDLNYWLDKIDYLSMNQDGLIKALQGQVGLDQIVFK